MDSSHNYTDVVITLQKNTVPPLPLPIASFQSLSFCTVNIPTVNLENKIFP